MTVEIEKRQVRGRGNMKREKERKEYEKKTNQEMAKNYENRREEKWK